MEALSFTEIAGAWLSIFLTLCIFSYLYEDNPIYKLAEHLFLGVSIGYGVVEVVYGVLLPNLFDKLVLAESWTLSRVGLIAPLVMFLLLFTKFSRKYGWLARIPIAFLVAAFAGVKMTGEANKLFLDGDLAAAKEKLRAITVEMGGGIVDRDRVKEVAHKLAHL